MRKIVIIFNLIIALTILNCTSRTKDDKGTTVTGQDGRAEIIFKEYEHHFGQVAEGEKISWQFTFENNGTSDLVLNAVTTTCGCTVPKYDTKPIPPGRQGSLEVIFDTSGRNGMQTKTVTVKSNASKPIVLLKISAEVQSNHN